MTKRKSREYTRYVGNSRWVLEAVRGRGSFMMEKFGSTECQCRRTQRSILPRELSCRCGKRTRYDVYYKYTGKLSQGMCATDTTVATWDGQLAVIREWVPREPLTSRSLVFPRQGTSAYGSRQGAEPNRAAAGFKSETKPCCWSVVEHESDLQDRSADAPVLLMHGTWLGSRYLVVVIVDD